MHVRGRRRAHHQGIDHAAGARGGRSKLWKAAKETVERGWAYAYRDRRQKKRDFRRLWITRSDAPPTSEVLSTAADQLLHGLVVLAQGAA